MGSFDPKAGIRDQLEERKSGAPRPGTNENSARCSRARYGVINRDEFSIHVAVPYVSRPHGRRDVQVIGLSDFASLPFEFETGSTFIKASRTPTLF
jgi:hypothetical protein